MEIHLTTRCADCYGVLNPAYYHTCASCDGKRLPVSIVDRTYIAWPTILIRFILLTATTACGYSESEMQLRRDREAELVSALQECGARLTSGSDSDAGTHHE